MTTGGVGVGRDCLGGDGGGVVSAVGTLRLVAGVSCLSGGSSTTLRTGAVWVDG